MHHPLNTTLLAITDSDKQFQEPIQEYIKWLSNNLTVQTVKPIKHGSTEQIITKETGLLIEKITAHKQKTESHVVLLSHRGTTLLSEDFAAMHHKHQHILYVVGGPYGVDESLLEPVIDTKISFGKQTMPHGLVKLVLLEQIRRTKTILTGKTYHY